jgi:agmatinase
MNRAYGPITVIHFDSHLDTWRPKVFGGAPSKQAAINRKSALTLDARQCD